MGRIPQTPGQNPKLPRGGNLRIVESTNSCVVGPSQWAVKHSLASHECFFV